MAATAFRSEERIGLIAAVAVHAGLVALLLWHPPKGEVVTPPDRIEVTISDDIAAKSTSPQPRSDARPDTAPELGEPPPPAEPEAAPPAPRVEPPPPEPRPVAKPQPRPQPKVVPKPVPAPKPVARPVPRPAPKPAPKPAARPAPKPAARPAAKPATKSSTKAAAKPTGKPGGSRIGNDFLEGVRGARSSGTAKAPPAQVAGPAVQSSLLGAISRTIRPHWQGKVPEGADSEKLVTILRWNLNRDGSLAGTPTVVRQEGITDANRPQAARHAEQAIRAVQLAAPFDLPNEYYDTWKRVTIKFDKRLAQ
jgi:outer membrane biosynthesis protein TonB